MVGGRHCYSASEHSIQSHTHVHSHLNAGKYLYTKDSYYVQFWGICILVPAVYTELYISPLPYISEGNIVAIIFYLACSGIESLD